MSSSVYAGQWPEAPEFAALAERWGKAASTRFLQFVWSAYDRFYDKLDFERDDSNLERRINDHLYHHICDAIDLEPFRLVRLQHEPWEFTDAHTRPPQPDFAFVIIARREARWPMEGKILQTDGAIADYVREIKDNFATGTYGSASTEAALLGYLLSGRPEIAFATIEVTLNISLLPHPAFNRRMHRMSVHSRGNAGAPNHLGPLRLHHLLMVLELP
jgi:hypothetical protein